MENSIQGGLRAELRKDIVVAAKVSELLKVHLSLLQSASVLGIDVLHHAEQLAHEIDHYFGVCKVYQLADVARLLEFRLSLFGTNRQDEIYDQALDCDLSIDDLRVNFRPKFDQEGNEARKVKLV